LPESGNLSDVNNWINVLDAKHIKPHKTIPFFSHGSTLNPSSFDVTAANYTITQARSSRGHDLLAELARRNRWADLNWLVEKLIDGLWRGSPLIPQIDDTVVLDTSAHLLHDINKPLKLEDLPRATLDNAAPNRNVVDHDIAQSSFNNRSVGHQCLGQIWESLGWIILDDMKRDEVIAPGCLQLFALLHRKGIMPTTIYDFVAQSAISPDIQPPTLHLLSSHILASLSDAECNEKYTQPTERSLQNSVLEYIQSPSTPHLPGSRYGLNVAGLRHEIWLELMLWSCLHGGWVTSGIPIIREVVKSSWSPLSWRELITPLIKVGEEDIINWSELAFLFDRRQSSTTKQSEDTNVKKTISSELITAYVEAIISTANVGVGKRGLPLEKVIGTLSRIKKFLNDANMSLESRSWDTVVQEILESGSIDAMLAPALTEKLLNLSSSFGEDSPPRSHPTRDEAWRPLAPYIVDGSAMSLGIAHYLLLTYISKGDFVGAFRTFQNLQYRTDRNKRLSLDLFWQSIKSSKVNEEEDRNVSSNQFPAFYPMLPASILGPFLELITEVKALEFGSWLLASHDIDGPIVEPNALRDPSVSAALIKFATFSNNQDLLTNVLQTIQLQSSKDDIPVEVLIAMSKSQFYLGSISAAAEIVHSILSNKSTNPREAEMAVSLLVQAIWTHGDEAGLLGNDLIQILNGQFPLAQGVINNIIGVIVNSDDYMAELCAKAQKSSSVLRLRIDPSINSFNLMFDGYVKRYGSEAGCVFLAKFSPLAQKKTHKLPNLSQNDARLMRTAGRARSFVVSDQPMESFKIDVSPLQDIRTTIKVRGRLKINVSTVRIVLAARVRELGIPDDESFQINTLYKGDSTSTSDPDRVIAWAFNILRALNMTEADVVQEIRGLCSKT